MSVDFENSKLMTTCDVTESPESGENVPAVISWWYHDDPEHPDARQLTAQYRGFIQHHRMHEHMQHFLTDSEGAETYLSLTGTQCRMRRHPLDEALQEQREMPLPNPFPPFLGKALVTSDMGMYVLVSSPQRNVPTWTDLDRLVTDDPASIGMTRVRVRADDQARRYYLAAPDYAPLQKMIEDEEDRGLRNKLGFLFNVEGL